MSSRSAAASRRPGSSCSVRPARLPGPSSCRASALRPRSALPVPAGISNCVGLALAERMLAARFNRPDHEIVNHRTFTICSDGDLQEGISAESCSLAGHLGLGRLVAYYDDNHISIEGDTSLSFSED